MSGFKVVLSVSLHRPFSRSLDSLLDLCSIWRCHLIKLSTSKQVQKIAMPLESYKSIWGHNPRKGQVEVPQGTEHFISSITVLEIKTK